MGGKLSAGDWVEVRPREEILETLDARGQQDRMPFMPEMLPYCGRRFRVVSRAHKTCDTVGGTGGRRLEATVHLEGLRCDGRAHGSCDAGCLLFWKTSWLKRCDGPDGEARTIRDGQRERKAPGASEAQLAAGALAETPEPSGQPVYVCQATQLPAMTELLPWWDVRQYVEDYTSGNAGLWQMFRGFVYAGYVKLVNAGIGIGPFLKWLYDRVQSLWGGVPYPRRRGTIPLGKRTPTARLDLQPGELVRVKSYAEILDTLNANNRNRGMLFWDEEVPFCGGTYKVIKRVEQIVDERSGRIIPIKSPTVLLENVWCQARYSDRRLFCPRALYSMFREIWLERVEPAREPDGPRG
jgi:hypothetical protein